jgi:hypothetical protein
MKTASLMGGCCEAETRLHSKHIEEKHAQCQHGADLLEHITIQRGDEGRQTIPEEKQPDAPICKRRRKIHLLFSIKKLQPPEREAVAFEQ